MNEYLLVPLETAPRPLTQSWMLLKAKEVYLGSVVVEQSSELFTASFCTPFSPPRSPPVDMFHAHRHRLPCHGLPTRVCAASSESQGGGDSEHVCACTLTCTSGPQSLARRTVCH